MANCHECNAEVATGKKLCEECAKKKIAEMDEPIEETTEEVDAIEDDEAEEEEVEQDDDLSDCTPGSERINRVIAAVIDGLVAGVGLGILSVVIGMIPIVNFIGPYIVMAGSIAFLSLRDVLFDSQSPGKKLMGFKVIKIGEENREIGTMTSVLRNMPFLLFSIINALLMLISIGPMVVFTFIPMILVAFAGFGVAGFELFLIVSTGKRFGDKLARTKVVKV